MSTLQSDSQSNSDNEGFDINNDDSDTFPNLSIIGICGSIGTGKSYTCSLLVSKLNALFALDDDGDNEVLGDGVERSRGSVEEQEDQVAFHIDTDKLAHGVYLPGSLALKEIEHTFGGDVIADDGTVNRKVLGGIVFNDKDAMAVSK